MFCPNCGAQFMGGEAFCSNCGKALPQMPRPQAQFSDEAKKWQQPVSPFKFFVKVAGLCIGAAVLICAIIGVIVYFVEYSDRPNAYNGAKVKSQTIWEKGGLSVKATKLTDSRVLRDALILKVKNGTGQDLKIRAVSVAVNGLYVPSELEQTVPDGKTEELGLEMDIRSFYTEDFGIKTPGIFTLELQALDPSSGEERYRSGLLTVKTTKADLKQNASFTGYFDEFTDLIDEGGIKVGTFGYLLDPIGPCFGIENNTDRTVRVTIRTETISGVEMRKDDHYYTGIAVIQPGAKGACLTPAYFEELKEMDAKTPIFPVTKFTGSCAVYDAYDGTILWEKPFEY